MGANRAWAFSVKEKDLCYIAYGASASTAFAIEAAGIAGHLVHISGLCSLSFNAVKGKVRASYIIYQIVATSTVMSYMKELPEYMVAF